MHRGIHPSTERAAQRRLANGAAQRAVVDCAVDRVTSGPAPIGDYLPRLRLRVRTIPTLIWRDGAWRVEWVIVSYRELLHVSGMPRSVHPATRSQA